jgi:hypothetical protein
VTRALVDTGSPITIFDRGAADALGVRIGRTGAETATTRLLGHQPTIQFEYIDLSLPVDPTIAWHARVGFIKDPVFQMAFQGILGTDGFLDHYAVTFNKYYDWFSIVPADQYGLS